ncbi:MAG TPA: polysaccharide deacetylase family protein [Kiloniellaceae bacterium]|nr:polysaccharide deacetylase family protein [Kiloniellaceae bacterium]
MIQPVKSLRRLATRVARRFARPCAVLMYHRIAEDPVDPWGLCVQPDRFAAQLALLSEHCDVVPLAGLRQSLAGPRKSRPTVAITFDDGYVDNLEAAKPLLERAGVPATVFITTGQIGAAREFWWDELEQLLLHDKALPEQVEMTLSGQRVTWDLTDRRSAYRAIWARLQPLPLDQVTAALDALGDALGIAAVVRPSHRIMSESEVLALSAGGSIEIGAHTVTHARLTSCGAQAQYDEMAESRTKLEALLGKPVTSFAYPFGDHDRAVVRRAGDAGFSLACTTDERLVSRRDDPLAIPRFAVGNLDGDAFFSWLRGLQVLRTLEGPRATVS